jgi:hypothetical protein
MSQGTSDAQESVDDVVMYRRGFGERHPMLVAIVTAELIILGPAAVLFAIGDPMSPDPSTITIAGELLVVGGLVIAAVSVVIFLTTLVIRLYTDFINESE